LSDFLIAGLLDCRTSCWSNFLFVGLLVCRTSCLSDFLFVKFLFIRTSCLSDFWFVGLLVCRTSRLSNILLVTNFVFPFLISTCRFSKNANLKILDFSTHSIYVSSDEYFFFLFFKDGKGENEELYIAGVSNQRNAPLQRFRKTRRNC
jgi:hypothetical protein